MRDDSFNWNDDDSVVVRQQFATAVYQNQHGEIVVRQEAGMYEENDAIVVLTPQIAEAVAWAILHEIGAPEAKSMIFAPAHIIDREPAPKDKTAAERQRRYRERQRNGATVTERNGEDRNALLPFDAN